MFYIMCLSMYAYIYIYMDIYIYMIYVFNHSLVSWGPLQGILEEQQLKSCQPRLEIGSCLDVEFFFDFFI